MEAAGTVWRSKGALPLLCGASCLHRTTSRIKGYSATAVWRTVPRCGCECCMQQRIGPPLDAVIGTSRLGQTCVGAGGWVCGWTGNCPCFAAAIALRRVRPHVNQSYISLRLFTVMTQYLDVRCVLLSIRPRHVPYQESSVLYSALHGWLFHHGALVYRALVHRGLVLGVQDPSTVGAWGKTRLESSMFSTSNFHPQRFILQIRGQRVPAPRGRLLSSHGSNRRNI